MVLTLDNLVKSLIGKYAKANHPITVLNPDEYFIITEAKIEDNKIAVRGENTAWFIGAEIYDEKPKPEPVLNSDGSYVSFMVKLQGEPFRCECGGNVFFKPDKTRPNIYECNSCSTWYDGTSCEVE